MQVTSWGSIESNENHIADYAAKQWGGLVGDYHLPLWQHFFARMYAQASAGLDPADISIEVNQELYAIGAKWTNSTAAVAGLSSEGAIDVAKELLAKWATGPLVR